MQATSSTMWMTVARSIGLLGMLSVDVGAVIMTRGDGMAFQQEDQVVEAVRKGGGADAVVTVTGEVVPGVECPAIVTVDGRRIALSYLPAGFRPGDRVTVRGSGYAGSATCQQEVLVVEEVSLAGDR